MTYENWTWIAIAGIASLAWVIVTWIKNSCKHEWENVGGHATVTFWSTNSWGQKIQGSDFKRTVQPVKCTKCGKNSVHDLFSES